MQTLKDNASVIENNRITSDAELYEMLLECPQIAKNALPGQIVHVQCGEGNLLRRPISICETDGDAVRICYDVRGKGTKWMSERKPGDKISLLGALGHGFTPVENGRALLVGGGIGIYPLLFIGKHYGKNAKALLGFRTSELVNYTYMFERYGIGVSVATDDGTAGIKGYATDLLRSAIKFGRVDIVYVCGPRAMMAAAAKICGDSGIECEVSMEERMGCGVGACLGCVCATQTVGADSRKTGYKRVCVDGPVFDAKEIVW